MSVAVCCRALSISRCTFDRRIGLDLRVLHKSPVRRRKSIIFSPSQVIPHGSPVTENLPLQWMRTSKESYGVLRRLRAIVEVFDPALNGSKTWRCIAPNLEKFWMYLWSTFSQDSSSQGIKSEALFRGLHRCAQLKMSLSMINSNVVAQTLLLKIQIQIMTIFFKLIPWHRLQCTIR